MSNYDDHEDTISTVLSVLKNSDYGSEDYNMSYRTLVKLEKKSIDLSWDRLKSEFADKEEVLYVTILDRLIDINNEEEDFSEEAEIVAKIIKADNDFVEFCKAQIGMTNYYPKKIKFKITNKLNLLSKIISLC